MLLASFSSFVSRPTAQYTAGNNGMKSFLLHFVKTLLAKCVVSCLSVSVKSQDTQIHLTVNALNMGLILYRAHSAAQRKKSLKTEGFVVISRSKNL